MCSICLQNPCHPRCPNAVRRVRGTCDECGEELYEDEYYRGDMFGLRRTPHDKV